MGNGASTGKASSRGSGGTSRRSRRTVGVQGKKGGPVRGKSLKDIKVPKKQPNVDEEIVASTEKVSETTQQKKGGKKLTSSEVLSYLQENKDVFRKACERQLSEKEVEVWAKKQGKIISKQASINEDKTISESDVRQWIREHPGFSLQEQGTSHISSVPDANGDEARPMADLGKRRYSNRSGNTVAPNALEGLSRKFSTGSSANFPLQISLAEQHEEKTKVLLKVVKDLYCAENSPDMFSRLYKSIGKLIRAARCSLFFVDPNSAELHPVNISALDDDDDSGRDTASMEVRIPLGLGIVGHVGKTGESIRIIDCQEDPRFSSSDNVHGEFQVKSLMCVPVVSSNKEILGVATLVNKLNEEGFTIEDEEILKEFLQYFAIGIQNVRSMAAITAEKKRTEFLLSLARSIFEEIDVKQIITKIMRYARQLTNSDRCSLFLVDHESKELYSQVFDIMDNEPEVDSDEIKEIRFPIGKGIAGTVAQTGDLLNIPDAYSDPRFNQEIDRQTGYVTKNILCMPIATSANSIVGVAQMVNKQVGDSFTKRDEELFQSFAVFCGLSLQHAKLYDEIQKSEQRHKVALEILAYHSTCREDELEDFKKTLPVQPDQFPGMNNFDFGPRAVEEYESLRLSYLMFDNIGAFKKFKINPDKLVRFVLTVKKNYRKVPYHNWKHAFAVGHAMYLLVHECNMIGRLTDIEIIALYTACLCHDLDHRGFTNTYQVSEQSPLAKLYSTAVMEHHHFNMCVNILNHDGHNIFSHFKPSTFEKLLKLIERNILATDLAAYFGNRKKLEELVNENKFDWKNNKEASAMGQNLMMTCCDVSAITKPWEMQKQTAVVIFNEFFTQGDLEKKHGRDPMQMMDRSHGEEMPKMQLGFIDFICKPAYETLYSIIPESKPFLDGCVSNREHWEEMHKEEALKAETLRLAEAAKRRNSIDNKILSIEQTEELNKSSYSFTDDGHVTKIQVGGEDVLNEVTKTVTE
eukprot:Nk52_evm48s2309 gene=Nk52_evmTU48s2309